MEDNKEDFSFEAISTKKPEETTPPLSEKLLEQLVVALTPKPFHKRHPIIFWGGIVLVLFIVISSLLPDDASSLVAGDRIAVVRVEGMIMDTKPTLEWIDEISKDDSVLGVLLRIDSPGGGAAASQEIFAALTELGKQKPIVASMGSTAASGGLMIAMAAQHIVANPSTVTGSIGVRMDIPQLQNIMEKIGIGQLTLKTGEFKDAGTFMRPMTEEERAYLEAVLTDMHEQFVLLVAEGRKMPVEKVQGMADGRIFTGRAAKEMGLVDELGGQDAALAILYNSTKVSPETPLYERPDDDEFWKALGGNALAPAILHLLGIETQQSPAFLYQY